MHDKSNQVTDKEYFLDIIDEEACEKIFGGRMEHGRCVVKARIQTLNPGVIIIIKPEKETGEYKRR